MKTTHLEDRHRDETKFSTENGISTQDEEESSTKSLLRRETDDRARLPSLQNFKIYSERRARLLYATRAFPYILQSRRSCITIFIRRKCSHESQIARRFLPFLARSVLD